ncbi:dnaJ-like protein 60 [Onthophagus taurus]|uniref:dnaJ-like protein 60 n=1 Tax=Onthophagus taurus TaxID=166361 RepID=UPI000C20E152|nr:dnaJ-like protein 60 [Onthophagus taurus]
MQAKLFSAKWALLTTKRFQFSTVTRNRHQSHYDVLKVKRDCSNREIKDAFIKLSKQYHPDANKSPDSNKKFVRIVEAYNILSKPNLRRSYDLGMIVTKDEATGQYYNPVSQRTPFDDPIFWHNRDKSQDKYYETKPYYGIKGLKKLPNVVIVLICLLVTLIGVVLQVIAINASVTLKRDKLIKVSAENEAILKELQEEAERNGNKVQLERLQKRWEEQNHINNAEL